MDNKIEITAEDFGLMENENEICFPPFELVKDFSVKLGWISREIIGFGIINPRSVLHWKQNE